MYWNACPLPSSLLRIELLWKSTDRRDLDLHVLRPLGSEPRRVYYGNRANVGPAQQASGFLDCDMPPDEERVGCVGGMETFLVPRTDEAPPPGSPYRFAVRDYSGEQRGPLDWEVRVTFLDVGEVRCSGRFDGEAKSMEGIITAEELLSGPVGAPRLLNWSPVFAVELPEPDGDWEKVLGCEVSTEEAP